MNASPYQKARYLVDQFFVEYENANGSKPVYDPKRYMGYVKQMQTLLPGFTVSEIRLRIQNAVQGRYYSKVPGDVFTFVRRFGDYIPANMAKQRDGAAEVKFG